jgi:hypothetical protein
VDVHAPVSVSDALPAPVVIRWWKWRVWLHPASWAIGLGAIVALVVLIALHLGVGVLAYWYLERTFDATTWTTGPRVVLAIVIGILFLSATLSATWLVRRLGRIGTTSFIATVPADDPMRSYIEAELAHHGPGTDAWRPATAQGWMRTLRGGTDARMFVDRTVADRAVHYDRTDRPVEPERVGGVVGSQDGMYLVVCGLLAAVGYWRLGVMAPLVWGFSAGFVAILWRMVRRRTLLAPIIVGQGWIQHGAARWTVEDSAVIATRRLGGAQVRVIGPPGVLTMRLGTGRSQDFETLWMRWMHPNPNLAQQAFDA